MQRINRGTQLGYVHTPQKSLNDVNMKVECQTIVVNSLADFCIWGSAMPKALVQNIEGETIGYCSQKGHGTRLIPAGSITAAQVRKLSMYRVTLVSKSHYDAFSSSARKHISKSQVLSIK